jgi:1-acyl-sn-glycerol-3-phosphate acyltransferase
MFTKALMHGLARSRWNERADVPRLQRSTGDPGAQGRRHGGDLIPRAPDRRTGRLYRGRNGVARLGVAAGVPIIPVGMIGTEKVQPIGQVYPTPRRGVVTVKFGKPIETTGRASDRTSLRALTDEVMAEIQKLTGQEYVPRYAPPKDSPRAG